MNWHGFIVFVIAANVYIWNGKDRFNKKECMAFFIKFTAILASVFELIFCWWAFEAFSPRLQKRQ